MYNVLHLQAIKGLLQSDTIDVVIVCFNMTETRLRRSRICMFQEYNKVDVELGNDCYSSHVCRSFTCTSKGKKSPSSQILEFFN